MIPAVVLIPVSVIVSASAGAVASYFGYKSLEKIGELSKPIDSAARAAEKTGNAIATAAIACSLAYIGVRLAPKLMG